MSGWAEWIGIRRGCEAESDVSEDVRCKIRESD